MCTGIIILNYNNFEDTVQCIKSIEEHNTAPVKYIVVDNGSTDKEAVRHIGDFLTGIPNAAFVVSPSNDGYARGNNKGLELAFADDEIDDVLILNNDVLFTSDVLPALIEERRTLPDPAILTPLLRTPKGAIEYNCARVFPSNWTVILPFLLFKYDVLHILTRSSRKQKMLLSDPSLLQRRSFPVGMPSGSFLFIKKSIFRQLGGFDPGTFLYYEENILCKRIRDLKLHNYCVPGVSAVHLGGATTGSAPNLFLQKCNLESADYYLREVGNMTFPQKAVWALTRAAWRLKFALKAGRWRPRTAAAICRPPRGGTPGGTGRPGFEGFPRLRLCRRPKWRQSWRREQAP